jgi:hypothetical protein
MGSYFSSPSTRDEILPVHAIRHYLTVPLPEEASTAPQDRRDWYYDFFEQAYCIPHRDGKSMIIFTPPDDPVCPNPRIRGNWAAKRLRKAYEVLGDGHVRITR